MAPGWEVLTTKGCLKCHRVRGVGEGTRGPDLARPQAATDLFGLGAAMWNHLPQIAAAMRELGIQRPQLTPVEMSTLASFLFTVQHYDAPGDAREGQRLFGAKRCAECHVAEATGSALTGVPRSRSPVLLAAAMWNHGPAMAEAMAARGITYPVLQPAELAHIMAYIAANAPPQGEEASPVVAGAPKRGETLFAVRGCAACHPVENVKGREAAPRLGTRVHHVNVTEFASLLWNHGKAMWAAMKKRGIPLPRLTGQDMADITAYLHTVHYFDPAAGRPQHGRQLVASKGCLKCHSIYRRGGTTASDLATSNVVDSPAGHVAAMWNHGRFMETEARRQLITLPTLTGQDLADIASYLAGLGSGAPKPR